LYATNYSLVYELSSLPYVTLMRFLLSLSVPKYLTQQFRNISVHFSCKFINAFYTHNKAITI